MAATPFYGQMTIRTSKGTVTRAMYCDDVTAHTVYFDNGSAVSASGNDFIQFSEPVVVEDIAFNNSTDTKLFRLKVNGILTLANYSFGVQNTANYNRKMLNLSFAAGDKVQLITT